MADVFERVRRLPQKKRELLYLQLSNGKISWQGGKTLSPDKRLVAYVVCDHDRRANLDQLRRSLQEQLPDYMVPAIFVQLDALPLTPNGKVDRRALPSYKGNQGLVSQPVFDEPRSSMESLVAAIWREVLGIDRISVGDNFFDLGGHSILAMRVIAKLEKVLGIRISPGELMVQSLGQMASSCEERMQAGVPEKPQKIAQRVLRTFKQTISHVRGGRSG